MKKLIFVGVIAAFAFALSASLTLAAGISVGNDTASRPVTDTRANFAIIDTNHPVSDTGNLSTFKYYASTKNPFRFFIVDSNNDVKWVSDEINPANFGVNIFIPNNPAHVESGYNVGMYFASTGTIPFTYAGTSATYTRGGYGVPAVGSSIIKDGTSNRIYSFIATGTTAPGIPFNKDECKKDGWKKFDSLFKNQGQCVSYVENGKALVETVKVPTTNGTGVITGFSTEIGKNYFLEVSGTYRFMGSGTYGIADAEWAYRNDVYKDNPLAPHGWTVGELTYPSIKGLDVLVDGGNVDWGDFNPLHVYNYEYAGTGNPIKFSIYDSAYGDNSDIDGGMIVNIYQLP